MEVMGASLEETQKGVEGFQTAPRRSGEKGENQSIQPQK